jgi:predicted transcriptional regulator
MNEGDIEVASRRAIYQEIADSPGIHFRALLDTLPYAQGTLQYHRRQLADEDLIDISDDGKYTRATTLLRTSTRRSRR